MNTYEKKYKEALGWMQSVYPTMTGADKEDAEHFFPELAESEDERIRGAIIDHLKDNNLTEWAAWLEKQGKEECALKSSKDEDVRKFMQYIEKEAKAYDFNFPNRSYDIYAFAKDILSWLEKQGENVNFQDKIQVDNQVTRNYNNVLVNLSQLKQVAKPTDNVEPKFQNGQWVVWQDKCYKVNYNGCGYELIDQNGLSTSLERGTIDESAHLWTIQDAKNRDVLVCNEEILLFKSYSVQGRISLYCWYNGQTNTFHSKEVADASLTTRNKICPATKEQRDALMKAMTDSGYEWDAENKELKEIEEEYNGEDYGIDSLFHAQRILEKTLGKVEGYQSDDGILEHKCAISAVKKLCGQKLAWSEEDEHRTEDTIYFLNTVKSHYASTVEIEVCVDWLKSLKPRIGG